MGIAIGIDGCRAGWVLAVDGAMGVEVQVIATASLSSTLAALSTPTARSTPTALTSFQGTSSRSDASADSTPVVGIDMPIGLRASGGARACDRAARALLGGGARWRSSSVFPAPARSVLDAVDFADANHRQRAALGVGLSQQSWNLVPRIRVVDALVRSPPTALRPGRVVEVHPELSFQAMAGERPLQWRKKDPDGVAERSALLMAAGLDVHPFLGRHRPRGAADDDVLDAFAVLWSARRVAAGLARSVPTSPEVDDVGVAMAIWT